MLFLARSARIVAKRPWCLVLPIRFYPSSISRPKSFPPRTAIPDEDLDEVFLKGSGPGGQKINKTSSAVQLKHLPSGLVVKSQATRSRTQNRQIARRILADKLEELEKGDESRVAIKRNDKAKKKASAVKKSKRKYRRLAEGKDLGKSEAVTTEDTTAVKDNEGSEK